MPTSLENLLQTIHALRSPGGCPWDRKQTLASASHHLLDEAAELVEAALQDDPHHVAEELADLLFMVCFCCEILSESIPVDLTEIARLGDEKLVRRHPHVFGDEPAADSVESQVRWNEVKAAERRQKGIVPESESLLKALPASTAPLRQAYVFQKNAAEVGFDWPDAEGVWQKISEEMGELREATAAGSREEIAHEVGDLLFAVANLARHLGIKPDLALRQASQRFSTRFGAIEKHFGYDARRLREASLDEMESIWQAAKRESDPTG